MLILFLAILLSLASQSNVSPLTPASTKHSNRREGIEWRYAAGTKLHTIARMDGRDGRGCRRQVLHSLLHLPLIFVATSPEFSMAQGLWRVPSTDAAESEASDDYISDHDDGGSAMSVWQNHCANACIENGTVRNGSRSSFDVKWLPGFVRKQCQPRRHVENMREPLIFPSKPIPGLYSRWQDD